MRVASMAGIRFFATGGIGGAHRGHPEDQSADLEELGRTPVAVFCAGAKIILDLSTTLEKLDSLAVPVLGYGCDEFPAFYTRHSPGRVTRVDGVEETARVLRAAWETGARGIVVAIPPPSELEGAQEMAERAVREVAGVSGADVTPKLLARMAELSGGRSVEVNVELVVNNARIAAQVARAFAAAARRVRNRRAENSPPVRNLLCYCCVFMSPKVAPCGSATIAKRPPGKSCGASISWPPPSTAFSKALSTSATAKYPIQ